MDHVIVLTDNEAKMMSILAWAGWHARKEHKPQHEDLHNVLEQLRGLVGKEFDFYGNHYKIGDTKDDVEVT